MEEASGTREVAGPSHEYDLLKVRPFDARFEADASGGCWILSFEARTHVRVSPVTKTIIECFDGGRTLDEIAVFLRSGEPALECTRDDLVEFVDKIMVAHGLVEGGAGPVPARAAGGNSMLWCHVPLVHTDRLAPLFALGKHLFRPQVAVLAVLAIVAGLAAAVAGIGSRGVGFGSVNSLVILVASYGSLIVHEVGHVSAAYRYGIRAGRAGIGMYLFWPVFYVDLTNGWRLGKKHRVVMDVGGMYFQLLFAVPFAVLGVMGDMPDLCVVALAIASLTATNLFPFLRLDGYWMICDALGLMNLSSNAFGVVGRLVLRRPVRQPRSYVVGALLYVICTIAAVLLGLVMVGRLGGQLDLVAAKVLGIVSDLRDGMWSHAMIQMNQVLVLLIPGVSLTVMLARVLYRLLKSQRGGAA